MSSSQQNAAVSLAGLPLRSPVLAAAGCAGTGSELQQYTPLDSFGAVITRSITLAPRAGGPLPRLVESASGLVNSLGLPGPGVEGFLDTELPALVATGATVVVSVWADHSGDFAKVAQRLRQVEGIAAIEVNLSHPTAAVPDAATVVQQVRRNSATGVPVFAKLGVDNCLAVARSCVSAGADGLSLVNAIPAVPVSAASELPALGAIVGGLSGPAIKPIALRVVWQVHEALPQVPIIGSGGIMSGADALEFILAGASAVALGTAVLNDPSAGVRVGAELEQLLAGRTVAQTCGAAHGGHE